MTTQTYHIEDTRGHLSVVRITNSYTRETVLSYDYDPTDFGFKHEQALFEAQQLVNELEHWDDTHPPEAH